jgi:hypothetical protein
VAVLSVDARGVPDSPDARLVITVSVDVPPVAIDAVALADAVGAAGGNLATTGEGGGSRIVAELPCE